MPVDQATICRLCERQAASSPGTTPEVANAGGQQLFIANLPWPVSWRRPSTTTIQARTTATIGGDHAPSFRLAEHRQLVLFDTHRDLAGARRRGTLPHPQDPGMLALLDTAVVTHAGLHGWPKSTKHRTRQGMRVMLGLQDTPGSPLRATDALLLLQIQLPALNVIEVASAAGMLVDDRPMAVQAWFAARVNDLPNPMVGELTEWFEVMLHGSTLPPRRRPRSQTTLRLHLRWAMPALTAWSRAGVESLREISSADIRAVLPPSGNPRSTMGQGLRSIFTVLKDRRTLFVNPLTGITTGGHERRQPLPLDPAVIRAALESPNPARAALAALTAFHGLRAGDLRAAHVTDISDGRLRIEERNIPLADPVLVRVAAWLAYRTRQWPNSANAHLFINHWTSTRTDPVGRRWLSLTLDMPTGDLREDRILHEIHATDGDVRRICDLFGLTVAGALRYLPATEPTTPGDTS